MGAPACQSMHACVPPYPSRDELGVNPSVDELRVNPEWHGARPFIGPDTHAR